MVVHDGLRREGIDAALQQMLGRQPSYRRHIRAHVTQPGIGGPMPLDHHHGQRRQRGEMLFVDVPADYAIGFGQVQVVRIGFRRVLGEHQIPG